MTRPKEIPAVCKSRPFSCFECPYDDCILGSDIGATKAEVRFRSCGNDKRRRNVYYKTGASYIRVGGGTVTYV